MDAYLSDRNNITYSDEHPILVAATSEVARARAERTIAASGLRVGAIQGAVTALWVEIDRDGGGALDELLGAVARDARDGRYAAIVSTTADMLDPVAARVDEPTVELIVNADDADRAAALALAMESCRMRSTYADVASDKNAERLRQLSEEVSRIASTLARLSTGPAATPHRALEPPTVGDLPQLSVETVRNVIRARRLRARYFSQELFADPAWDMLLDLLQAEIAQLRVPVSSLCIAAAVPATTALRWLKTMVSQGLSSLLRKRAMP